MMERAPCLHLRMSEENGHLPATSKSWSKLIAKRFPQFMRLLKMAIRHWRRQDFFSRSLSQ